MIGVMFFLMLAACIVVLVVRVHQLTEKVEEIQSRLSELEEEKGGDLLGGGDAQAGKPVPPLPPAPLTPRVSQVFPTHRVPPPPPPSSVPQAPPSPPAPRFDWENLLGLKGAAWLGGITLVITSLFFAKWAIDRGLITPSMRMAAMIAAGLTGLVVAELRLRRGYRTTANALSGAGIAILYVAFYAGQALYHVLPFPVAFGMMALTTLTAGLLSVRYDAQFTAILGLVGGFATPMALSGGGGGSGPVGLFSYILLLNAGLAGVALRKRWHLLMLLALVGTFVIETGWFGRSMAPERMLLGLVSFLLLGFLYLLLPSLSRESEKSHLIQAGAVGGTVPFLFALILATRPSYAGRWPILFAYVGLLDVALLASALFSGRVWLFLSGSVATAITLPLWASQGLQSGAAPWGPALGAMALAILLNLGPRLRTRLSAEVSEQEKMLLSASGCGGWLGLFLFCGVLVLKGLGRPEGVFLAVLAGLTVLFLERALLFRLPGWTLSGSILLALLIQIWIFQGVPKESPHLIVPSLLTLILSIKATLGRHSRAPDVRTEDERGVLWANTVALIGLFACLEFRDLRHPFWPIFAGLAVTMGFRFGVTFRQGRTALLPVSLFITALFCLIWQEVGFTSEDLPQILGIYAFFYVAFLGLPFLMPQSTAREWQSKVAPWVTSALAGPFLFFPVYRAVVAGWGKGWIGALPLLFAACSVACLAGVARRFTVLPDDETSAPLRLRNLALFGSVALGFVALAIPLQVNRQWITVGWALEALAVWWLFQRLPHPGLKFFGALLCGAVAARLLLNPAILEYHERGRPILNWILYTYGISATCALLGSWALRRAETSRKDAPAHDWIPGDRSHLATLAIFLGLLEIFALINLEIVDYFSTGAHLEIRGEAGSARDSALSVAWGIYAMGLLVTGLWRRSKGLRILSLCFLLITVAKVFLYDLSNLGGLYRILSFLGLGISLILVSLLYQRFVFRKESSE